MPKDALDLAKERIDQQAMTLADQEHRITHLEKVRDELAEMLEAAQNDRAEYSKRYHALAGECSNMVQEAQHKHLKCAVMHGCPKEYAL